MKRLTCEFLEGNVICYSVQITSQITTWLGIPPLEPLSITAKALVEGKFCVVLLGEKLDSMKSCHTYFPASLTKFVLDEKIDMEMIDAEAATTIVVEAMIAGAVVATVTIVAHIGMTVVIEAVTVVVDTGMTGEALEMIDGVDETIVMVEAGIATMTDEIGVINGNMNSCLLQLAHQSCIELTYYTRLEYALLCKTKFSIGRHAE